MRQGSHLVPYQILVNSWKWHIMVPHVTKLLAVKQLLAKDSNWPTVSVNSSNLFHSFFQKISQRLKRFQVCAITARWWSVWQVYQPVITPLARSCNRSSMTI